MTTSQEYTVTLVRDLMHIGVTTCPIDTPLAEAACTLLKKNVETLIVLDESGHAIGRCGRQEVVAAYARTGATIHGCKTLTAGDVMRPGIPEIPPDIPATAAAQIMLDQGEREMYLMHRDCGISWPAAVFRLDEILYHLTAESKTDVTAAKTKTLRQSPREIK